MKQTITCVAALAAMAGVADANQTIMSSYSRKRVREVRTHLEKIYGKGLVGLFNEDGKFMEDRLSLARTRPKATWVNIGGNQIDAETSSAWFYGLSKGLQYKGMAGGGGGDSDASAASSNCFFALYGMTDSIDGLVNDAKSLTATSGSVNWFNIVGYSPIHLLGNLSVTYEYCGGYQYLDQFTSYGSLDYGFMSERFSRQVTYYMTEFPAMMNKKAAASAQAIQKAAPAANKFNADADPNDPTTVTSLQWDVSDVNATGGNITELIPKDNFLVGEIWGEILSQMLGTTLSPET